MQLTLLPPLLPGEAVTRVGAAQLTFTPGERILATIIATGLEGSRLLMGGQEMTTGGGLPYPAGTLVQLDVVDGGEPPTFRLVGPVGDLQPKAAWGPTPAAHPAVSTLGYGLAAAIMAARTGPDVATTAAAFRQWLPSVVGSGVLTPD